MRENTSETNEWSVPVVGRWIKALVVIILLCVPSTGDAQEIQSLEHDPTLGQDHSLVQVDSDTYAAAYQGNGFGGFITTFTIPADGSTITQVQSLEHDALNGTYNSLIQVDSDTYVLAYQGDGEDGFIKTFTISADGSTITQVQSLEHDTQLSRWNSLIRVDADTFALAYHGGTGNGKLKTFTIPADGSTITQVHSIVFDPSFGYYTSLVQVDSDTFAIAYAGSTSDGVIQTYTISADGATISQAKFQIHDTGVGQWNSMVMVDSDTFALAYAGVGGDGFLKTFTIPADGSTVTEIQSLEHDLLNGFANSLIQVDSDTFALSYAGDGLDGFLKTFTIPADGSTITEVQSLEHDPLRGFSNSMVQIDSDTFVVGYSGDGAHGFIKTFAISPGGFLPVTLMSFDVE